MACAFHGVRTTENETNGQTRSGGTGEFGRRSVAERMRGKLLVAEHQTNKRYVKWNL